MRKFLSIALVLLMVFSMACACAEESGWQNILLLGGDARNMNQYDRSDTMIILSINRDEGQVKMTSVMRDTWVNFPGREASGKINAATVYGGPELAVATVNSAFGTDIEDYVIVNMEDLVTIIDLLGGVDIEITDAERKQLNSYAAGYTGKAYSGAKSIDHSGMVHLNGLLAMSYCRIRYTDNDYKRVMRQQTVLLELANKAQNMEVQELSEISDQIFATINTNLDDEELEDLVMAFMTVDIEEVGQYRIPVDGTFRSGMFNGVWLIDPDFEQNQELLREFIYGD